MIPIYNEDPIDWQDLQLKIAKIFSDMGFTAEVEKDIQLVRGKVNVDVFASRKYLNTKEIHITECKYWSKPVPKAVVHSTRTVLADSGANSGYIISKKGFQKGAFEAAGNSNLYLMTFQEFQAEFRTKWIDNVVDELETFGYPFRKYVDPMEDFYDKYFALLSDNDKEEVRTLANKYQIMSMYTSRLNYKNIISGKLEIEDIEYLVYKNSKSFPDEVHVNCLMDYFQYLKDLSVYVVQKLDHIYGRPLRKN